MFVGADPETRSLILEFFAADAESIESAKAFPVDGFDERTARLLIRSGVLAEAIWSRLPSGHDVSRDALATIGRVGMMLAGPSAISLYSAFAERFLQFALDAETDDFRDRNHLWQTLVRCHESGGGPRTDLNVEEQLLFPAQCLWIQEEESADDDEALLMLFDYIVAGQVTAANDLVTFAYAGLVENSRTPLGKVYLSADGYMIHQIGLPRDRFTPPLLRAAARLTVGSGLAVRRRLRGEDGENG